MYTNHRDAQFLQRADRYSVEIHLTGETFGSGQKFSVNSANISESGMLIDVADQNVPWNVGTILELTIDFSVNPIFPNDIELIKCNAKVARIERKENQHTTFGIQFIDLDIRQRANWIKIIRKVEASQSPGGQ